MAQSIQYLDDKTVKKIMKEYEKKTGKKLNLDYTAKALGARFIDTESEAGKMLNISSQMMRDVLKETNNMNTVMNILSASMEKI